jgi:hypothetical protein
MVIVRNANMDYQVGKISTTDATSFTIPTSSSGGTSGSFGAYSLGFTCNNYSGGTMVSAPSGDHADVQLISMNIHTGGGSSTFDLIVPASDINGAGMDSSLMNCFIPDFNVRNLADNLSAVAATMVTNPSSLGYSGFRFGNLGNPNRVITLHF